MKIAIHHRKGSFSDHWIAYCELNHISYKVVNAYSSNIMEQVKDCDTFMWHFHHANHKDMLVARSVLFALEQSGKKVFPDFNTNWHFDNKVAQKYLLEVIGAPLVPSYVFYDKKIAEEWATQTSYPKIFKLSGGAGALNVKLVNDLSACLKLIKRAFGGGFSPFDTRRIFKERFSKFREGKESFFGLLKGIGRLVIRSEQVRMEKKERGYAYFQQFIPDNDGDFRVIIIGQKYAYGMKRMNRVNDFRASGSSNFVYDKLPRHILEVAFDIAKKLKLQSVAFDFIFDAKDRPLIIEMSYGFGTKGSSKCEGYYTEEFEFRKEQFNPFGWMIENLIKG